MKPRRSFRIISMFVLAIVFTLTGTLLDAKTVDAKTPDHATPAEETVCDELHGALRGLCNAYCEAMDCDDPDHRASDDACLQVLDSFDAKAEDGETMPCLDQEQAEVGACHIDACTPGSAPGLPDAPECEECVASVCELDDFCCRGIWDEFCVEFVNEVCGPDGEPAAICEL